jgi:hypothetical protein
MIDQHHLLECILWPNGDGTFRKIINRAKRLDELGIYKDFKLTIPIDHSIHQSMHREFEKGTEYERAGENAPGYGRTGEKSPMYGRTFTHTEDVKRKLSEDHFGDKNPSWKGDDVGAPGAYIRAKNLYKAGEISEEDFQPYRDAWNEYKKSRK